MREKVEFAADPDRLVAYTVTLVALNPDQFIVPVAFRSETKAAVGATEFGVLLKVIVYVPEPNHATVTLAALLLL